MNELIEINNLPTADEAMKWGEIFAKSCMMGLKTPEEGAIMAMTCIMEKITPLKFINTYDIIKNKPTMKADAMLANFRKLGGIYEVSTKTEEKAEIILYYKESKYKSSLTWKEAQKEKFVYMKDGKTLKDNWSTPRGKKTMLWARAVSDGVRTVCPEVNFGTYTPEEVNDFVEPEKEMIIEAEVVKAEDVNLNEVKKEKKESEKVIDTNKEIKIDPSIIPCGKYKGKTWDIFKKKKTLLLWLDAIKKGDQPLCQKCHVEYITSLLEKMPNE